MSDKLGNRTSSSNVGSGTCAESVASTSTGGASTSAESSTGTTPRRRKREPPPSLPPLRRGNSNLKRVERPLDKYCHVAVPHYVDLLDHHRGNIEKYRQTGDWDRAQREQLNAARLAQQLRGVTQDMEALRSTLDSSELKEFDSRMQPARQHAIDSIELFIDSNEDGLVMIPRPASPEDWSLHSPTPSSPSLISATISATTASASATTASNATSGGRTTMPMVASAGGASGDEGRGSSGAGSSIGPELVRLQEEDSRRAEEDRLVNAAKQRRANLAAWETLQAELVELHDLLSDFAHMVQNQRMEVASAEAAAAAAMADAQAGLHELEKAAKSRTGLYPVVGAIMGGCLGGPVGLLAGFKLGSLAAIGGGFLGALGGKMIKKLKEK